MQIRHKILSLLTALTLFTGGALAGVQAAPLVAQPQPTPTTTVLPDGPQVLGIVIRLYDSGPAFHLDDDHWQNGIDVAGGVSIDASGFLTFRTAERNAVLGAYCAPDETLSARGVTTGVSNGSHLVRVRFTKPSIYDAQPVPLDLSNAVHYSKVSGAYSNIWCTIVHDGAWTETP